MGRADGPHSWETWSTNVLIKQEEVQQYHWGDGFGMGNMSRRSGPGGEATRAHGVLGQLDGACMRGVGCCVPLHPGEQVGWSQAGEPRCETAHYAGRELPGNYS